MILREVYNTARFYQHAITLNRYIPRFLRTLVFLIASLLLTAIGITFLIDKFYRNILSDFYISLILSVGALLLVAWFLVLMASAFWNSFYFRVLGLSSKSTQARCTYELAEIILLGNENTYTHSFLSSEIGRKIFLRCGVEKDDIASFLAQYNSQIPLDMSVTVEGEPVVGVPEFVQALLVADTQLIQFLSRHEIQEKELLSATTWVMRGIQNKKRKSRFWSREQLGLVKGLAKNWSYGRAYTLEKFATTRREAPTLEEIKNVVRSEDVSRLEEVLARNRESNALLTGRYQEGLDEVVRKLSIKITSGRVLPELEHKQIFFLDGSLLLSSVKDKNDFETILSTILSETMYAGNIILAITHFPQFVSGAHEISSDVIELLDEYVRSGVIQFIATAETGIFHQVLEQDRRIRDHFEQIQVTSIDREGLMRELQTEALLLEKMYPVSFTIQSISAVIQSAERYFNAKTSLDAGLDLLNDVVGWVGQRGESLITDEHIYAVVEEKTGIKAGKVGDEERQQLMQLEKILHKRIVGQDEAIDAIAHALRRARSGIGNPNRPMGSFLFLGPTGVGKTEVAKTLAKTFFKSDDKLIRFDMSEYANEDALERLIGSFATGTSGILASMIREKPYGVLLLDEFEKAHSTVHNLFLQILDEGYFSDMRGERVNARNMIIVATSNEQADVIWDISSKNKKLSDHYDEIISSAIKNNVFRPELLNRFDGIILFHPISNANKEGIADKILREIQLRMKEKGITLVITDELRGVVANAHTDPKFGARAMNRFAQEKIEQVIADKIIQGEIKPGAIVELSEKDIQ
ncbi:MAG: AAA family ATPase [Candidatus Paceibacterota bacterium]